MKEYVVRCEYVVTKDVIVLADADPKDPSNWGEILEEIDVDCQLSDVLAAEEND